jgi:hypothetical protein
MTSRSADWVFGEARLISSARTIVAKIGPGWNSNSRCVLVVDRHAGDVAREEVGGELDAAVRALHRARDRACELGLAGARVVLEEQVPLGEHAGQRESDDVLLAEHGLTDVGDELVEGLGKPGGLVLGDGHRSLFRVDVVEAGAKGWCRGGTTGGGGRWVTTGATPS